MSSRIKLDLFRWNIGTYWNTHPKGILCTFCLDIFGHPIIKMVVCFLCIISFVFKSSKSCLCSRDTALQRASLSRSETHPFLPCWQLFCNQQPPRMLDACQLHIQSGNWVLEPALSGRQLPFGFVIPVFYYL